MDETVHAIDAESLKQLTYGLDGSRYQWIDLDSEELSGVLTEQADAWYYKRNLGNGTFGAAELVAPRPVSSALSGAQQLLDLAGEGHLELVQFDGPKSPQPDLKIGRLTIAGAISHAIRAVGWTRFISPIFCTQCWADKPSLTYKRINRMGAIDKRASRNDVDVECNSVSILHRV